ncbi:MAG: NAD(P)H-dependent glycerol-3-phosphate dehydrogenase [Bacteroidales bacterium]|nr:NAD(P)H-dependent glycerol-3-phosphate dehydrogenase [Bacteroidales bacterium]
MGKEQAEVAVLGSGSWATALVKMFSSNVENIAWYIREKNIIEHIQKYKHNPKYLSTINLDTNKLILTPDINMAVKLADILVFVIPSAFLKKSLENLRADISGKLICSAIKGIVPEDNYIIGDFFHKRLNIPYKNMVVLTGPTHAEEIAMEKLTFLTIASKHRSAAERVSELLQNHYLRTFISDDITGTEYAAVIKNIYAIAAGMADGLGFGDNFLAVLLSNAATEMHRFVKAVYKNERDFNSSPYLGDLLVTAYSKFSRNRMFGNMIGKGYSVRFTRMEMEMVAEGYYASDCINEINKKLKVEIPIADTVYRILYQKASPSVEFRKLIDKLK